MLSKSISTSLKIARLKTTEAKLLFTWLIPHCDDDGRTQGEPLVVKGVVLPLLNCTIDDVSAWLTDLHEQKLIFWYEVDGEKYIQINLWLDHQEIRKDRYKSSIYPCQPRDNQKTTKRQPRVAKRPPKLSEVSIREVNISEESVKEDAPEKIKYRDNVFLTKEEHESLVEKNGKDVTERMLDTLDNYKGAHGKKYKSDYRAILSWVEDKVKTHPPPQKKFSSTQIDGGRAIQKEYNCPECKETFSEYTDYLKHKCLPTQQLAERG